MRYGTIVGEVFLIRVRFLMMRMNRTALELVLENAVPTPVIPLEALVPFAGVTKVFVVTNGVARARQIEVGRVNDSKQEVLSGLKAGETDAKVRTEIRQPSGGKPIELDYYLEKSTGAWKVYDIEVGGISLVTNYRDEFAGEVRNNGIDGLIRMLQAKNKTAPAATAKK